MPDAYFTHNGRERVGYVGRTKIEECQFSFALHEMSRMYAYHEVSVVVLPQRTNPSTFKDGSGTPLLRNGDRWTTPT